MDDGHIHHKKIMVKLLTSEECLAEIEERIKELEKSDLSNEEKVKQLEFQRYLYKKKKEAIEKGTETKLENLKGKEFRQAYSQFMDCLN